MIGGDIAHFAVSKVEAREGRQSAPPTFVGSIFGFMVFKLYLGDPSLITPGHGIYIRNKEGV